ncbi:MAG TPA: BON domain-containing protein [Steroidobacteraceae bacterium]|nr:BON domain-containing protein [Steroidobacteraceae bacterium]
MKRAGIVSIAAVLSFAGSAFANDTATGKVDDAWITTKVKSTLATDSTTPATDIHVNTKSGVVVLTGNVQSKEQKKKAEDNARSVQGVKDVENQLVVAD